MKKGSEKKVYVENLSIMMMNFNLKEELECFRADSLLISKSKESLMIKFGLQVAYNFTLGL